MISTPNQPETICIWQGIEYIDKSHWVYNIGCNDTHIISDLKDDIAKELKKKKPKCPFCKNNIELIKLE